MLIGLRYNLPIFEDSLALFEGVYIELGVVVEGVVSDDYDGTIFLSTRRASIIQCCCGMLCKALHS